MNFRSFDLNLLRVFDALLETNSTTLAGQKIGLSQPAVSAALARLRHALQDPLFIRQGRQLVPTDLATSLRDPLRDVLAQTEMLLAPRDTYDPARSAEDFKISGSDFFAEMLLPQLARHLSEHAPGMRIQMVDVVPDRFTDAIDHHNVDIALVPDTQFPDWIETRPLFRSEFRVIARRGHPQLSATSESHMSLDQFCDLTHILFSPEGDFAGLGDDALTAIGRSRQVVMTMPTFAGICTSVAQSDLIAMIPQQLADRLAPQIGLHVFHPPMPMPAAHIVMIWNKRSTNTPGHRWLRDQIAHLLTPLDARDAR
ncbi:LysR family transcriptional regulator [Rhodobacteraceae bacterium M382]|nr:LysR family transcriptional regulator [Rhodobacteraceae bacterium M382]